MSSALAIASVTALLKHLLENGLAERNMSDSLGSATAVTAVPPDHVPTGPEELPRLNLFLYQLTPHLARRRAEREGDERGLALDLYYLISAYGGAELQTELLLGGALQVLRRELTLDQAQIQASLDALSSGHAGRDVSPAAAALARSSLARQVREIRFEPLFLSLDEVSKLWSALQARYRPSAAYKASLAVIE